MQEVMKLLSNYYQGNISADRLRESLCDPEITNVESLADTLMDMVDRRVVETGFITSFDQN